MTRTILVIAFIFSYLGVFGQSYQDTVFIRYNDSEEYGKIDYVTDTVILDIFRRENLLIGTTILTGYGMNEYYDYGLELIKITKSDCQDDGGMRAYGGMEAHINSIILTDSTLTIDINFSSNCCFDFLCYIAVDTADILQLELIEYGTNCACLCCFGLTYHLKFWEDKDNLFERKEIKAVMIGDNRKTLKEIKR